MSYFQADDRVKALNPIFLFWGAVNIGDLGTVTRVISPNAIEVDWTGGVGIVAPAEISLVSRVVNKLDHSSPYKTLNQCECGMSSLRLEEQGRHSIWCPIKNYD